MHAITMAVSTRLSLILTVLLALLASSHGFLQPSPRVRPPSCRTESVQARLQTATLKHLPAFSRANTTCRRKHSVACFGFNLPPGKSDSGLREILVAAISILGLIVFFASPLGGLLFAAVNSMLALAFITPLVLILAFNTWQFFNTVQGNCPSCRAPLRVLKDGSPSICFSCGSIVQSNDGKTIDFAPNVQQLEREETFFESFFNNDSRRPTSPKQSQQKKSQYRRERTIIDVEVEDD